MGPESSLPHSQEPTTSLHSERGYSSPRPFPFPKDPFYYYAPFYACVLRMVPFIQCSPPKPCLHLSFPPFVLHFPPFLFPLCCSWSC